VTTPPRKPTTFDLDDVAERLTLAPERDWAADEISEVSIVATRTAPRTSWMSRLFWGALGGLVSLAVGLGVTSLIEDLFARYEWLGWAGIGLAGILLVSAVILLGREALALRRLARIDALRARAEEAILQDDRPAALAVTGSLLTLYETQPRTARARAELQREMGEIIDGADLMHLSERLLMTPLDAEARRLIGAASRRVSLVTAVAPRAVIDIAVVAVVAVSLIRQIATVYGARPGTLGFFRLLRHVLTHLAVTGGMAAGEGMLDQLVGHGLAARLSAKLGEGVINGILTARVGLAAMAVCRPLPYAARSAPTLRDVAGSLFEGSPKI